MDRYGFGRYLSAAFPSQINVEVSEFCNLLCVHCPYESVIKTKGSKRRNLDEALHTKLIDEIAEHGKPHCRFLRYTGDGEPLLHPRLPQMLAYAVDRTELPVNLTTNGLLLTEDRAHALIQAGVSVFDISLDAHDPETYAKIRVGGELAVAHANTRRLIGLAKASGKSAKVVVSFVRQPLNETEVDAFKAFWTSEGADQVVIRNRHSCGGASDDVARAMWKTVPAARTPCLYPWERLVVKPDGVFSYCPVDWKHEAGVGTLTEQTVREVWQGPAMQALRAAHLNNDYRNHAFCGQCPDWSITRWPDEGRSYATMMHEFTTTPPERRAPDIAPADEPPKGS